MTAVVGILNKQGVALAADSAVTVTGRNKKIYNTANKLFSISKYHPVAVMVYNSASLVSTPWETIIKMYRSQLKDKSFDTVVNYRDDFIEYLRTNNYFTTPEKQMNAFIKFVGGHLRELKENIVDSISTPDITSDNYNAVVNEKAAQILDETILTYGEEPATTIDFKDYTFERFIEYSNVIDDVVKLIFTHVSLEDEVILKIKRLFYNFIIGPRIQGTYSGLVFAGFGDNEIYPSISSLLTENVVDNRLRYVQQNPINISDDYVAEVVPYAQTDVINLFLKGIDQSIEDLYLETFLKSQKKILNGLADKVKDFSSELATIIRNYDTSQIVKDLRNEADKIKLDKQINPTLQTVAILSKEDLAEMAESLIYLTYLKRRISSDEESVGGPIDVAIISKGDGFIWKKRKHYFEEHLNKNFFTNYFNR